MTAVDIVTTLPRHEGLVREELLAWQKRAEQLAATRAMAAHLPRAEQDAVVAAQGMSPSEFFAAQRVRRD